MAHLPETGDLWNTSILFELSYSEKENFTHLEILEFSTVLGFVLWVMCSYYGISLESAFWAPPSQFYQISNTGWLETDVILVVVRLTETCCDTLQTVPHRDTEFFLSVCCPTIDLVWSVSWFRTNCQLKNFN